VLFVVEEEAEAGGESREAEAGKNSN